MSQSERRIAVLGRSIKKGVFIPQSSVTNDEDVTRKNDEGG